MTIYSNLFSYIPFLASNIYKDTFKPSLIYGIVGLFESQAFEWTANLQF